MWIQEPFIAEPLRHCLGAKFQWNYSVFAPELRSCGTRMGFRCFYRKPRLNPSWDRIINTISVILASSKLQAHAQLAALAASVHEGSLWQTLCSHKIRVSMSSKFMGWTAAPYTPARKDYLHTFLFSELMSRKFTLQLRKYILQEVISRKEHVTYSFVLQRSAWRNGIGIIFWIISFQLHKKCVRKSILQQLPAGCKPHTQPFKLQKWVCRTFKPRSLRGWGL